MALKFRVVATCGRARSCELELPHGELKTPVFMPVGTKGAIKGILYEQLKSLGCSMTLANTYHLAFRPGKEVVSSSGGIHGFTSSEGDFLTDSGGFQMVSLCRLSEVTDEGVKFKYSHDAEKEILLTPEESIKIQNHIGADVIMALDDVVSAVETNRTRLEKSTHRTTEWLDRCIQAHAKPEKQALFGIVQGTVWPDLRRISLEQLKKRNLPGYAIGGLSGGESKADFWRTCELVSKNVESEVYERRSGTSGRKAEVPHGSGIPNGRNRGNGTGIRHVRLRFPNQNSEVRNGVDGVGELENTARSLQVRFQVLWFPKSFRPIDENCDCPCCLNYSRSFLHYGLKKAILVSHLLTVHNIRYMMKLCGNARKAIEEGTFGEFVRQFIKNLYINQGETPPKWVRDSLLSAGIDVRDFFSDNSDVIEPFD